VLETARKLEVEPVGENLMRRKEPSWIIEIGLLEDHCKLL